MKKIFSILMALISVGIISAAEADLKKLNPKKPEDRRMLIEITKKSSNGKSNKAAAILAKAGYMDELLEILKTTTSYNTMQAIAQTKNERTIPIFESRLRKTPDNRYLVGSLAYVQNRKASPILIKLLKRHPDSKNPTYNDMVTCILNAIVFNKCQDAIPILRQRFAKCKETRPSQINLKSNYAITLLSLEDPTGIPWLKKRIRADIESKHDSSHALDRLATICDWMPPRTNIVNIEDKTIMKDLLPELTKAAARKGYWIARDATRILRVLTRHDFKPGDITWQKWYAKHSVKHPIYTKSLDRAVKLCVDNFNKNLTKAGKSNKDLADMVHFIGSPDNGFAAHNKFLWKLESHPEYHANVISLLKPTPRIKNRKALGFLFKISLISRALTPKNLVFKKNFGKINITVQLCLYTTDEKIRSAVIDCAKRACEPLSNYENFYKKMK